MFLVGMIYVPIYLLVASDPQTSISMAFESGDLSSPGEIIGSLVTSLASEVIFIFVLFFIGKHLGGTANWKKVFCVVCHSYVIYIPVIASIVAVAFVVFFVAMDARAQGDGFDFTEEYFLTVIGLPLVAMIVVMLVFAIWGIVAIVKATKIVNDYGTLKAIGVLILSGIAATIIQALLGLL